MTTATTGLTLEEFVARRAADEFGAYSDRIAAESAAKAAEQDLAQQRTAFVERTLADAALEEGAATAARNELHATVSSALEAFVAAVQQRDRAIFDAVAEARSLGLVDVGAAVAVQSTGPGSGLRINGRRVQPSSGWHQDASRVLADAVSAQHRASR